MVAALSNPPPPPDDDEQRLLLSGISWEQYSDLLEVFGDDTHVRATYCEGALELMNPSPRHDRIKTVLARLLEAWADEMEVDLDGAGSATFRNDAARRGLEPDECYSIGLFDQLPDIAIEIAVSRWKLDKLDVYRGLGVREVWVWRDGAMTVHVLDGDHYETSARSALLPALDLELLARFVRTDETQRALVEQYRAALREVGK